MPSPRDPNEGHQYSDMIIPTLFYPYSLISPPSLRIYFHQSIIINVHPSSLLSKLPPSSSVIAIDIDFRSNNAANVDDTFILS